MSIFPRRLQPGGTLIIHVRHQGLPHDKAPHVTRLRHRIESPTGVWETVDDRELEFFPERKPPTDGKLKRRYPSVYGGTPPAIFADYFLQERRDSEWLLDFIRVVGGCTNFYFSHKFPDDAPLGRYELHRESYQGGIVARSGMREKDHFFLDKIELGKFEKKKRKNGFLATVKNLSPEPTPVVLWTPRGVSGPRQIFKPKRIELGGKADSEIALSGSKALISYAQNTEFLRLASSDDPFVQRNSSFLFQDHPDMKKVYLFAADGAPISEVRAIADKARTIWLGATGFATRSELRDKANAKVYDEMLKERLLLEKL